MSDSHSRVPGWVWITTPAMAFGFTAFVIYLTTIPAGNEMDAVKGDAKAALEKGIETVKKEAIKQAAPDYEFYKLLEKQTVNVDDIKAYHSTPKGAEPKYEYTLQVGSFKDKEQAENLRAKLLLDGLKAYRKSATNDQGTTWHRVMVGPFYNRSKLNAVEDRLAERRISPLLHKKKI